MEEFNRATWTSWILLGYKFIRYRNLNKDTVLLKPFKEVDPEEDLHEDFCFFGIMEDEISEMADNEIPLLDNFKFYVEE